MNNMISRLIHLLYFCTFYFVLLTITEYCNYIKSHMGLYFIIE